MKRCIVIPDSFKGTLSADEAASAIAGAIREQFPDCQTICLPIADGGEGTVDCFVRAAGAEKVFCPAVDPFGRPVTGFYARLGTTAVIEMAAAAGLTLVSGREDPMRASTYGVGMIARHALDDGCTELVFGLGGSATNDGGTGMAAALGAVFKNREGKAFVPTGESLSEIAFISVEPVRERLRGIKVSAICDIENPLYGERGAAYVFAPQKGAGPREVKLLDENLRALDRVIQKELSLSVADLPGAGAAGGMGAGIVAFLGGTLRSGIETVLDLTRFDDLLTGADLVFTGEGRFDSQSLGGKAIDGITRRAREKNVPVIVLAGCVKCSEKDLAAAYSRGITAVFSATPRQMDPEEMKAQAGRNLALLAGGVLRLLALGEGLKG